MYQPKFSGTSRMHYEFNRFEFRVFLLLDGTKAKEPSLPSYLPGGGEG